MTADEYRPLTLPRQITRAKLTEAIKILGLDPTEIAHAELTPTRVTVRFCTAGDAISLFWEVSE